MPTYEYLCENCSTDTTERVHDVFVPLSELDTEIKCPDCGEILKRLISAPCFRVN